MNRGDLGRLRAQATHPREALLHHKYRDWTMVVTAKFIDNLAVCRTVTAPGAIVECGTWRGGMSAAMAETLPRRMSYLLDSYQGLPPAGERDGERARHQLDVDALFASEADAREAMRRSGERFELMSGWFEQTVPKLVALAPPIAVLRLDGDWYDSTMICLTELVPLVVAGGVVIIDDYDAWEGCTRATHDWLSRTQRTEPLERTRYGVTFLRL